MHKTLVMAVLALVALSPIALGQSEINLFDNETLFGLQGHGDVQWSVVDGNLVSGTGSGGWISTTSQFANFKLTAKVKIAAGWTAGLLVRAGAERSPYQNGSSVVMLTEPKDSTPDWRDIIVKAEGGRVTASISGQAVAVSVGSRPCGYIGLTFNRNGKVEGGEVQIASLKLMPIDMKPLFNGQDLTGWNIIPEHASVFTVVDGALNIKNGNGQIETAGTYRDFLLQLDIFSNGPHLNSGVFFRGPVGVWWKGYESQVRNQWEGEDRTQPVDFGTGGNYGNQAARKVVSSDGEWFTKTIVCDGNHAAVWINGYLVSDFLDMRPPIQDDNGKAGFVPGPGTIHLQGHDPTTDLSFKNILIQQY